MKVTMASLLPIVCLLKALVLSSGVSLAAESALPERTLHLRQDRPLGAVYFRKQPVDTFGAHASAVWEFVCLARGTIRIPENHEAQVEISRAGLPHLAALKQIGPHDVQSLILRDLNIQDDHLTNVLHLRGLREIRLSGNSITDAGVRLLTNFPHLKRATLNDTLTGDEGAAVLSRLASIEELGLIRTRITDAALEHLGEMRQLSVLDLLRTKVTDDGLARLGNLKRLNNLRFGYCNVTDRGLAFVSAITNLEVLDFSRTHATDVGLGYIAHLRRLRSLRIDENAFTDSGLAHLTRLSGLEEIHVSGQFTDTALGSVGTIKRLKKIYLRDGYFTDDGLEHLANLQDLEHLNIETETKAITHKGMAALAQIRSLKSLELNDFPIGPEQLDLLKALPSLRRRDHSFGRVRCDKGQICDPGDERVTKCIPETISVSR